MIKIKNHGAAKTNPIAVSASLIIFLLLFLLIFFISLLIISCSAVEPQISGNNALENNTGTNEENNSGIQVESGEDNLGASTARPIQTGVIDISTSIMPFGEFIEKIGSSNVKVTVMVPPGADPHIYEPGPRQLEDLSKSSLYMANGAGLEFELVWMDRIKEINKHLQIIDCSEGITLLNNDPHAWLSPENAKIICRNIYEAILDADSGNKDFYSKNFLAYVKEIDDIDKKITGMLSAKKNKVFMVYHPAWAYFAGQYGLKQISIEKEGGKEPTAKELEALIIFAKENHIKAIIASPQSNPKSAEVIAAEIGAKVIYIDYLGKNYIENMATMLEALEKYME